MHRLGPDFVVPSMTDKHRKRPRDPNQFVKFRL